MIEDQLNCAKVSPPGSLFRSFLTKRTREDDRIEMHPERCPLLLSIMFPPNRSLRSTRFCLTCCNRSCAACPVGAFTIENYGQNYGQTLGTSFAKLPRGNPTWTKLGCFGLETRAFTVAQIWPKSRCNLRLKSNTQI